uniref:28 kDa Metastriate family member n=1 Tax=Rhipicephalus appendiculatus TaxID=34631 RepID=A0A131Z5C5_RHIAP
MLQKYPFFLCIFLTHYCASSAQQTTEIPEKIGENTTAFVYIYFNSSYLPNTSDTSTSREISTRTEEIPPLFKELFKQVETHFHKKNVSINFKVEVAEVDDHIAVYYTRNASLNASGTLQNLIMQKSSEAKPPTGIAFYYTNYSLLHKLRRRGDGYTRSVNYEATTGTFCTEEPSGAVVKHDPNSLSTRNTVFAFTQMLGASYNSKGIHPRERGPLNNKLIECQKYSKLK